MEPESPSLYSQNTDTCPYPKPDKPSPHFHITFHYDSSLIYITVRFQVFRLGSFLQTFLPKSSNYLSSSL